MRASCVARLTTQLDRGRAVLSAAVSPARVKNSNHWQNGQARLGQVRPGRERPAR